MIELDKAFGDYIKERDLKVFDHNDGYCITCGCGMRREEFQCCHFIGRKGTVLRWYEGNAYAGCGQCNVWRSGEAKKYKQYMIAAHGAEYVNDLWLVNGAITLSYDRFMTEKAIKHYRDLTKALKKAHSKGLETPPEFYHFDVWTHLKEWYDIDKKTVKR